MLPVVRLLGSEAPAYACEGHAEVGRCSSGPPHVIVRAQLRCHVLLAIPACRSTVVTHDRSSCFGVETGSLQAGACCHMPAAETVAVQLAAVFVLLCQLYSGSACNRNGNNCLRQRVWSKPRRDHSYHLLHPCLRIQVHNQSFAGTAAREHSRTCASQHQSRSQAAAGEALGVASPSTDFGDIAHLVNELVQQSQSPSDHGVRASHSSFMSICLLTKEVRRDIRWRLQVHLPSQSIGKVINTAHLYGTEHYDAEFHCGVCCLNLH
jgi:hypothetical protein